MCLVGYVLGSVGYVLLHGVRSSPWCVEPVRVFVLPGLWGRVGCVVAVWIGCVGYLLVCTGWCG